MAFEPGFFVVIYSVRIAPDVNFRIIGVFSPR